MIGINDLPSDLLSYLFEFLSDKQIFQIECVCRKWQIFVRKTLEKKFKLKKLIDYSKKFLDIDGGAKSFEFLDQTNINILEMILKKCPNIQSIDLSSTHIRGKSTLLTIGKLCPKLKEINFKFAIIDVCEEEMNEFAQIIGPQLIKCKLTKHDFLFSKIMLMHMKNVEEVSFWADEHDVKKQSKYLFDQLKSCEKLTKLEWLFNEDNVDLTNKNIDSYKDDLSCVVQRLTYLKTNLTIIRQFDFGLENLTELRILDYTPGSQLKNNEINFANLTKFGMIPYSSNINEFMEFFSKWKMPKLQHVEVDGFDYPDSFYKHIKHIKSLKCWTMKPKRIEDILKITNQLINFECDIFHLTCENDFQQFSQCLNVLITHRTLQNIKLNNISDQFFNVELFDKLIELAKIKLNVFVTITLRSGWINERFDEYKKKFEETKMKNLQMKINLLDYPKISCVRRTLKK